MKVSKVDVHGMEKQRYESIKKTGKYLELDILIDASKSKKEKEAGNMPVIEMEMRKCGREEVACLYAVLKRYISYMEENYPLECMIAKLGMKTVDVGTIETSVDNKKDKK